MKVSGGYRVGLASPLGWFFLVARRACLAVMITFLWATRRVYLAKVMDFLGGQAGFPLYPTCTGCVFVGCVPHVRDSSAHPGQQKHQPLLRRGAAPIPAAQQVVCPGLLWDFVVRRCLTLRCSSLSGWGNNGRISMECCLQAESLKTSKHRFTPTITGRPKFCNRLDGIIYRALRS